MIPERSYFGWLDLTVEYEITGPCEHLDSLADVGPGSRPLCRLYCADYDDETDSWKMRRCWDRTATLKSHEVSKVCGMHTGRRMTAASRAEFDRRVAAYCEAARGRHTMRDWVRDHHIEFEEESDRPDLEPEELDSENPGSGVLVIIHHAGAVWHQSRDNEAWYASPALDHSAPAIHHRGTGLNFSGIATAVVCIESLFSIPSRAPGLSHPLDHGFPGGLHMTAGRP